MNIARSRYYCPKCNEVEYTDQHPKEPFDAAKIALEKKHGNCNGKPQYQITIEKDTDDY